MSAVPKVSEAEFEEQHVEQLATLYQWRWCHFRDSRREVRPGVFVGDDKARGWPDMVLCRDRVVYAELKSETGKPTEAQRGWLDWLAGAGGEAYLWRPSDLEEITKVLSKRWGIHVASGASFLSGDDGSLWTPGSLWLPGGGRADERRGA